MEYFIETAKREIVRKLLKGDPFLDAEAAFEIGKKEFSQVWETIRALAGAEPANVEVFPQVAVVEGLSPRRSAQLRESAIESARRVRKAKKKVWGLFNQRNLTRMGCCSQMQVCLQERRMLFYRHFKRGGDENL